MTSGCCNWKPGRRPQLPLVEAVLVGLAAWRASALVSYERGPGDVFLRLREALGFQHDERGEPTAWPETLLAKLVSCPWCLSLWAAAGFWAMWEYVSEPAVIVMAAAAVVVAVERWNHQ